MVFEIAPRAYYKVILHCLKYSQYAVNGVLLGKAAKGDVWVADAVPLFHLSLGTAPMLEIALTQVDCYCQKNDLSIVAYYQANELASESEPDPIAKTIISRIKTNYPSAQLVMVDNANIQKTGSLPLTIYSTNKWEPAGNLKLTGDPKCLDKINILLRTNHQHSLIDFDNHLDDVMLDWLNPALNQLLITSQISDI